MSVKIYYLDHSGVAVTIDKDLFVFDYYNDNSPGLRGIEHGTISKNDLESYENIYVFVSHGHEDHFNSVIYKWKEYNSDIKYIMSSDLRENIVFRNEVLDDFLIVDENEEYTIGNINIKTFGSTDIGVSFLISMNKINLFHSGDLNWWHWKEFSEKEKKREEDEFKNEIKKLEKLNVNLDIAFVPVDPRLEEYYYLAGEYFIRKINPQIFIPIHLFDDYDITAKFTDKIGSVDTNIIQIKSRGLIYKFKEK